MQHAPVWMPFWSHQSILDQPKLAWELLKESCLRSFQKFLASSHSGNAMETTLVAVQFLAWHLEGKEKWQIEKKKKRIKTQWIFKCGFKEIPVVLHLVKSDFSFVFFSPLCSSAHAVLFYLRFGISEVLSAALNLFSLKPLGRVCVSVGDEYFLNFALSTFLIKSTSI